MNNNEVILTLSHTNILSLTMSKLSSEKLPSAAAAKFRFGYSRGDGAGGPETEADCPKHVGVLAAIGGAATTTTSSVDSPSRESSPLSLSQSFFAELCRSRCSTEERTIGRLRVKALSRSHFPESSLAVFSARSFRSCLRQTFAQVRAWVAGGCRVLGAPIIIISGSILRPPSNDFLPTFSRKCGKQRSLQRKAQIFLPITHTHTHRQKEGGSRT